MFIAPSLPLSLADKVVVFESADVSGQFVGFSADGSLKVPMDTNNEERHFSPNVVGEVSHGVSVPWMAKQ